MGYLVSRGILGVALVVVADVVRDIAVVDRLRDEEGSMDRYVGGGGVSRRSLLFAMGESVAFRSGSGS